MTVRLCYLHELGNGEVVHIGNIDHVDEHISGQAYVFCTPSPGIERVEFGAAFKAPDCNAVCGHTTYFLQVHCPHTSFPVGDILIIKSYAPAGWLPDYYPVSVGNGSPRPLYWTGESVRCTRGRSN